MRGSCRSLGQTVSVAGELPLVRRVRHGYGMQRNLLDLHAGEAFGRYELLVPIASGGMSMVWAARLRGSRGFQKLVAIKTLTAKDGEHALFERLLLEEVRLASQVQHPNVAQYLDLGERDGVLFAVMEWIDGEALGSLMRRAARAGGVPLKVSAQVVEQACKGLHAAHELRDAEGSPLGLVHCDVSPQNLMVGENGAVRLIDFGIAKATRTQAGENVLAGKLAFMAPEQARGEPIDRRVDVFSLGIVLYLLTTGRHPFPANTPTDMLRRIVKNAPVVAPSVIHPSYPRRLERVVLRALAHDRADRFASAAELLSALIEAYPNRATEPEVGAFVQRVAGDVLSGRRSTITAALRAAEARVSQVPREELPRASLTPATSRLVHSISTNAPLVADSPSVKPGVDPSRRRGGLLVLGTFTVAAVTTFAAVRSGAFTRWTTSASGADSSHAAASTSGKKVLAAAPVSAPRVEQPLPSALPNPPEAAKPSPALARRAAARRSPSAQPVCRAGTPGCRTDAPPAETAETSLAPLPTEAVEEKPETAPALPDAVEEPPVPEQTAPPGVPDDAPLGERYGI